MNFYFRKFSYQAGTDLEIVLHAVEWNSKFGKAFSRMFYKAKLVKCVVELDVKYMINPKKE